MEKEFNYQTPKKGAHALVLLYPLQGHINPMLQFSKRLAFKGLKITVITTTGISFQISSQLANIFYLDFITVFDGFREGDKVDDLDYYFKCMRECISQSLHELLCHFKKNSKHLKPTPKIVIYNSVMPWVLNVVKQCDILCAPFFTQSCLVDSIFYHVYQGALTSPLNASFVSLPSFKHFLRVDDMPRYVSSPSMYPAIVRLMLDQFSTFEEAHYVFVNTVDKLEIEVVNWMAKKWPVKAIGPAIPSMYLDKRLPDDKEYGLNLFKPETKASIQWLDAKENGSVVYISMGSVASLGQEQMEEMAMGLERCNKYFIWVVRTFEKDNLPLNFQANNLEKGFIVSWCPQLEVLAHPALGCFVTHCGWNSTLEAISLGVPIVAFPQWTDQPTNAKCMIDLWGIGIRVKINEKGIVTHDELEFCIREVMHGKRAKDIKNNVTEWKQHVKEAIEEGGSSDKNIEEFATKLLNF